MRTVHYDNPEDPPRYHSYTTVRSIDEAVQVLVRLDFERRQEMEREAAERAEATPEGEPAP